MYSNEQMMSIVQRRLEEVKDEILENMRVVSGLKEEMIQVRRRSKVNPQNEREAEEMRTNREWLTANSTFKFLQRLDVIDNCWYISELYKVVQNGDVEPDWAIMQLGGI